MKANSTPTYFKIRLSNVAKELEDFVTGECFENGALGVSEKLDFRQVSLQYDPEIIEKPFLDLDVFFESHPGEEFQLILQKKWPDIQFEIIEEEQKDWNEEWKKGFEEFELVDGIWVVPSWRKVPESAKKCLLIDPGMAFGTGTHETTRLASQALGELSPQWTQKHISLIDVGTGTGILAMLAIHLGAKMVVGTEIDPMAREVAKENVERNNMSTKVKILDQQVDDVAEKFPIVMANIIDGVLINIQDALKACLQENGQLLLTGILEEREDYFTEKFELPSGYQWQKRWQLNEWVALLGGPA